MINSRYIIQKKIGQGRSKVFSIIDTEFPEREAAVKFLPYNSSYEEKQFFREEYFILQSLDHPNIIKPFELGSVLIKDEEDDEIEIGSPFIITEYFNSVELLDYNRLNDEKQLHSIIKQICSVLFYLHQSNYIYYDLKAENILISEKGNFPVVKLIDFGFSGKAFENASFTIRGTPNYLAPEIIKNESHDHRVDLYALGVLLYKIIYGRFPHEYSNELEIYKAHLDDEIEFDDSIYSKRLIKIVEKLLKKSSLERYANALEILADLDINIDFEITKDFIPAKVLSGRKDVVNIINTYINDDKSNEVFTITGFDGAGKSSLLNYIYEKYQNSILIENPGTKTGLESIKFILKKILFNEILYKDKADHIQDVMEAISKDSSEIIQSAKMVFNTLPPGFKLIILFDNFNIYDSFTSEVLTSLIRIFQIKGIKVILTESSDYDQSSLNINNTYEIQLNPFTEHHLYEFLNLSYISSFPKDELQKYIALYSDLLPGNIRQFIKDLILLNVLQYRNGKCTLDCSEETILAL
ncbi:MAG: serine/threonine-protein kinase, partial [Ignavibacteriaceae bacterium]|nr:serine/threonine-protein kinase [Ignavibacteriaceae bacterium]